MSRVNSFDYFCADLSVPYVERSSKEHMQTRNNTPEVLNSTELSVAFERGLIMISFAAPPETQIVTIE